MRLLALAIRVLIGAAFGMFLWLVVTMLVDVRRASNLILVQPRPAAGVAYGDLHEDVQSPPPDGVSREALVVLRSVVEEHVSAGHVPAAIAVVEQVQDDSTRAFLRLVVVRQVLMDMAPRYPSPPPALTAGSQELQSRISLLQDGIAVYEKGEMTLQTEMRLLAANTVSAGHIPQTGPMCVICFLAQGKLSGALNLQNTLVEHRRALGLFKKELSEKLAAREAIEQQAKEARAREEREEKLKAEACIADALLIAERIDTDGYRAEAFQMIAREQRRLDPSAARKSLETAGQAALNASIKKDVEWWNRPWLYVIGSILLYIVKPTIDAYCNSLVPWLQGVVAWIRWLVWTPFLRLFGPPVAWLVARPPLAWAVGRNGKPVSAAENGTFQQLVSAGIRSNRPVVDSEVQTESAPQLRAFPSRD